MEILKNRGVNFVGPESGSLACGETGEGRMSEVCDIAGKIKSLLAERSSLHGKRIIVTAGGTREPVDAVRFIGNRSSGKMGKVLAEELLKRGAQVDFICAAMEVAPPAGVNLVRVETAEQIYNALLDLFPKSDGLVMSAAVGDYRAKFPVKGKVKKKEEWQISLEKNRDILASIAKNRGNKVVVGFAAETENHIEHGRLKLAAKGLDMIVVNDVSRTDIGFGSDQNEATILFADGESVAIPKSGKKIISKAIIDSLEDLLKNKIQRLRPA
jgi:phosphopantothenoylcysteine decarboxylase/phosphopantothenate--cysteine ligase